MTASAAAPLESVLATGELVTRPAHARDLTRENQALLELIEEMAEPSRHLLHRAAEIALELCSGAGSAGVSISFEKDGRRWFRWTAVVGAMRDQMWSIPPQESSPSVVTASLGSVQLFRRPDRHFRYLAELQPVIQELLVVPLIVDGVVAGTLWVASHEREREFDSEDARALSTLGAAAASGFRANALVESLRQSGRHKDEFLAVLSHEMRNPLAAMGNALKYLSHAGSKDPDLERARAVLRRQLAQVNRLGDDLLDVARIGQGTLALHKERTDLVSAVKMGREAAGPALAEYDREVDGALPDGPLWLEGDATRLAQIVTNLLTNTARRTRSGGRVSLELRTEGNDAVLVVAGETDGIAAGWARSARPAGAPEPEGLQTPEQQGIGLELARRLTDMHGGRPATVSVGHGRENGFEVRLPLLVADGQGVALAERRPELRRTRDSRRRERVLIVDDSVDSSDSLAMLLRSWGHEVRTAQGASAGLRVEWEFEPHAVILDIEMPGKNGYEVAAELRVRRRRDLLLIALSGHAREEDRARSLEAGFDHHMTKPADTDMLQHLLS